MVNYTRLAKDASRLIQSNGRKITFVKLNKTPADENRPWNGPSVNDDGETNLVLSGVFVPPNAVRQLGEGTEFRDLVTFSEQIIITAQGENDLREFTSVIDRDDRWGIVDLQVLRPGDVSLIAFVGVRR